MNWERTSDMKEEEESVMKKIKRDRSILTWIGGPPFSSIGVFLATPRADEHNRGKTVVDVVAADATRHELARIHKNKAQLIEVRKCRCRR